MGCAVSAERAKLWPANAGRFCAMPGIGPGASLPGEVYVVCGGDSADRLVSRLSFHVTSTFIGPPCPFGPPIRESSPAAPIRIHSLYFSPPEDRPTGGHNYTTWSLYRDALFSLLLLFDEQAGLLSLARLLKLLARKGIQGIRQGGAGQSGRGRPISAELRRSN